MKMVQSKWAPTKMHFSRRPHQCPPSIRTISISTLRTAWRANRRVAVLCDLRKRWARSIAIDRYRIIYRCDRMNGLSLSLFVPFSLLYFCLQLISTIYIRSHVCLQPRNIHAHTSSYWIFNFWCRKSRRVAGAVTSEHVERWGGN